MVFVLRMIGRKTSVCRIGNERYGRTASLVGKDQMDFVGKRKGGGKGGEGRGRKKEREENNKK